MILGISATQVTQLVAQKFTKVTRPLNWDVDWLLPSSKTNFDSGAISVPELKNTALPTAKMAAAAAR